MINADSKSFSKEMTEECLYVTPVNIHSISVALWGLDDQQSSRGIFDRLEVWLIPQQCETFCSLYHNFLFYNVIEMKSRVVSNL